MTDSSVIDELGRLRLESSVSKPYLKLSGGTLSGLLAVPSIKIGGTLYKDPFSSIATNTSHIATNTSHIATNTSHIATNTHNIATNTSHIATNVTNINKKLSLTGGSMSGAITFPYSNEKGKLLMLSTGLYLGHSDYKFGYIKFMNDGSVSLSPKGGKTLSLGGVVHVSGHKIVERVSNAHGIAFKFYDGSMICYFNDTHNVTIDKATGHMFQDDGKAFSFPVAFRYTPAVSPVSHEIGGSGGWQTTRNTSTKAVTLHMFASRSGATGRYGYIAVGVWR